MSYAENKIGDVITFPGEDFYDDGVCFIIREDRADFDTVHLFEVVGKCSAEIVYSGSQFDCEKEMADRVQKRREYEDWLCRNMISVKEV